MYLKINDSLTIHYEVYGTGKPLIFLHGNKESIEIYQDLKKELEANYQVYLIDSRSHGLSSKTKELSYDLMVSDLEYFLKTLKIEKPTIFGFSDGAIVALKLAIKDGSLLNNLILAGVNLNPLGFTKKTLREMKFIYFFTRSKYYKMMLEEPDIKLSELEEITNKVHLLFGENDCITRDHQFQIYKHLKNRSIDLIPHEDHFSYVYNNDKLYYLIKNYLSE